MAWVSGSSGGGGVNFGREGGGTGIGGDRRGVRVWKDQWSSGECDSGLKTEVM